MGWMMGGTGSAASVWVPVVLALAIVAVAAAGWLALSGRAQRGSPAGKGPGAEEAPRAILQRRYAAGEIDEDEYLRRLAGLSQR